MARWMRRLIWLAAFLLLGLLYWREESSDPGPRRKSQGRTPLAAVPGAAMSPRLPGVPFPKDSPESKHPVERAVAAGDVVDSRVVYQALTSHWQRERLVKSPVQPGLLRVVEDWDFDASAGKWNCTVRNMYLADQLIVKFRSEKTLEELEKALAPLGMEVRGSIGDHLVTVHLPAATLDSDDDAVDDLQGLPDVVESIEPDGVGFGSGLPNDPSFSSQWGLRNTGQSGGVAGADVGAVDFWDIMVNAPGVVVAVLDSGLNFTHPDLIGTWWINPGEIAGDQIDNDSNGKVDDVRGWDFVNGDNDPTDDHGHGSNVSGIITANRNNSQGGCGLIGGVKILPCKILNSSNSGTTSNLISAVTYARKLGAPVFNLSLQNYPFSSSLSSEFDLCNTAGITLVICAGNQGVDNDVTPNYPSSYTQTNIIAVGNHDRTDVRWSGSFNPSNYGRNSVDLFAPGTDILGPVLNGGYDYYVGTSQATPFVTAMAAAIKSVNPAWKAPQIKSCILGSVIARPAYQGQCTTGGRLNAVAAIASAFRQMPEQDSDGDGFSNLTEYLAGTRIDDASSRPVVMSSVGDGLLQVTMPRVTRSDAHMQVETSTDLIQWTTSGVTDASTGTQWIGQLPMNAKQGFLRLRALPSP